MAKLLFITDDHTEDITEDQATHIRQALAQGRTDMDIRFDNHISNADPAYTVYLDGKQIHPTPANDLPDVSLADALALAAALDNIIVAALRLAAAEWNKPHQADFDHAHLQLDHALKTYAQARNNTTVIDPTAGAGAFPAE